MEFTDLICKSMDWFLYDKDLRYERVNYWILYINLLQTNIAEQLTSRLINF